MTKMTTVTVDVDVDLDDLLNGMSDTEKRDLAEELLGSPVLDVESQWRTVARAIRHGDTCLLHDTLSRMAWDQCGVVIPVVPLRSVA